jgi:hypothetical protein
LKLNQDFYNIFLNHDKAYFHNSSLHYLPFYGSFPTQLLEIFEFINF